LTRLLVDTSVLIKWFHSSGELELIEARALRDAHLSGDLDAHIVDLAVYEVGNVLVRALHWSADDVADQLDDLLAICGTPLVLSQQWLRHAAALATEHNLSFYDAAWAAAALGLDIPLISADARLIDTGLAESPAHIVRRLRLRMP
jgi:predicted nucleic acid-binding protein